MAENNGYRLREIDFGVIFHKIIKHRKRFAVALLAALILSSAFILCVPRYYVCEVRLAPESTNMSMSGLGSLASSLGLNISNMATQDAIVPELYPDLMESVDFQTGMFTTKVRTKDGKVNATYYKYLHDYQKYPWWSTAAQALIRFVKPKNSSQSDGSDVNPFMMTKDQSGVAKMVKRKIRCAVDKKTNVITINVEDQDPLVCATIADSARVCLQQAITRYRTNKARIDLDYSRELNAEAKRQYDKARKAYAAYADANQDLALESFKAQEADLENEMQLKYTNYQQTSQQLQLAKAKLQERTPAFTILQSATVPLKPAGPKRMLFVLACMAATFFGTLLYVYRKDDDA